MQNALGWILAGLGLVALVLAGIWLGNPAPATVSRLLKVLQEEGWVNKLADGGYAPGPRYRIAARRCTRTAPLN